MSSTSLLEAGNRIGRSFSLGTFLPTTLLLLWVVVLLYLSPSYGASLSWPTSPLPDVSWLEVGLVSLAFLILSLALHPLVFANTQLLEGYWGASWLGNWAAGIASRRQRARLHVLDGARKRLSGRLRDDAMGAMREAGATGVHPDDWMAGWLDDERRQALQPMIATRDAAAKARERYPESASRVLPTALGNVLRREEDRIGAQYGLSALTIAGHLAFIVPSAQSEYLDDARQQLDTAVRLCTVGLIAFAATFAWLLPAGWSLSLALVPLAFSYVSYLGAISAAQEYMYAFGVLLDLNRFSLYRAMHLPLPTDGNQEVTQNSRLTRLLSGIRTNLQYEHSS